MMDDAKILYIELLKKTLTFSLWPEPLVPIAHFNASRSLFIRLLVHFLTFLLRPFHLVIGKNYNPSVSAREEGKTWPLCADTMVGMKRLNNLQMCIETVLREGVDGDLIETGVWRGGACIFMRGVLAVHGVQNRKVFVVDSFEGLPPPDLNRYPQDKGDAHSRHQFLSVSQAEVEKNFSRYGLLDTQVVFIKGFFHKSLPQAPIRQLSLLRLDGDMYGSTMDSLENLYSKLSPGGFCIVDDYALAGCRQAVDDYRAKHNITEPMMEIDWTGRFWRKEFDRPKVNRPITTETARGLPPF